ncbi:MAG: hypothetical protein FJX56_05325 [Alphaproteobacteria bacterium]|nr:hypothetical protein [Alphaproteobacteria bacterium]
MAERTATLDRLAFHAVDAAGWPDLERLLEGRGGPKTCWCMTWRTMPAARGPRPARTAAADDAPPSRKRVIAAS